MAALVPTVRVQTELFDLGAEADKLRAGRTDVGAVATFTGICRGDENGQAITALRSVLGDELAVGGLRQTARRQRLPRLARACFVAVGPGHSS